jgi:integrase/recombinase XerD
MADQKASTSIFINKYVPNTNGLCSISIKVTFNRQRRYYPTPITLTIADFEKSQGVKPRNEYKEIALKLQAHEKKAADTIAKLPIFTWELFERNFFTNRSLRGSVENAFSEAIKILALEGRAGTAESYQSSQSSLKLFSPKAIFAEITPAFLKKYEKWMLENGRSVTTVGIYLRNLRALINNAINDGMLAKELYPFGKKKYEIPTANNIKKALSLKDIASIYNYKPAAGSTAEKLKDYWVFLYLCNGINVKDFCLLKHKDIHDNMIEFQRAKTARTKRKVEPIRVTLLEEMKQIIKKWGTSPEDKNNYVFPVLSKDSTPALERDHIKLITKLINKYMKSIAAVLNINSNVTTYVARHSYATVMKRSGASTEFIGEALGHSNVRTTQAYLSSFEDKHKNEMAKALVNFKIEEI